MSEINSQITETHSEDYVISSAHEGWLTWGKSLWKRFSTHSRDQEYVFMKMKTAQYLFVTYGMLFFVFALFLVGGVEFPGVGLRRMQFSLLYFILYPGLVFVVMIYMHAILTYLLYRFSTIDVSSRILAVPFWVVYLGFMSVHFGVFEYITNFF